MDRNFKKVYSLFRIGGLAIQHSDLPPLKYLDVSAQLMGFVRRDSGRYPTVYKKVENKEISSELIGISHCMDKAYFHNLNLGSLPSVGNILQALKGDQNPGRHRDIRCLMEKDESIIREMGGYEGNMNEIKKLCDTLPMGMALSVKNSARERILSELEQSDLEIQKRLASERASGQWNKEDLKCASDIVKEHVKKIMNIVREKLT